MPGTAADTTVCAHKLAHTHALTYQQAGVVRRRRTVPTTTVGTVTVVITDTVVVSSLVLGGSITVVGSASIRHGSRCRRVGARHGPLHEASGQTTGIKKMGPSTNTCGASTTRACGTHVSRAHATALTWTRHAPPAAATLSWKVANSTRP
jgi:hypothetical protein